MPEIIEMTPFQYSIRSKEVAQALIDRSFILIDDTDGFLVQAPDNFSATKARNIISTMIKLYSAAKDVSRAQNKYDDQLVKLELLYR